MTMIYVFTCSCGARYKVVSEIRAGCERTPFICPDCAEDLLLEGEIRSAQMERDFEGWHSLQIITRPTSTVGHLTFGARSSD